MSLHPNITITHFPRCSLYYSYCAERFLKTQETLKLVIICFILMTFIADLRLTL